MMSNPASVEQTSAQVLFFLYELAKVFSSSLNLDEVAEYILDGACALIGTELGLLCALEYPAHIQGLESSSEPQPVLRPYVLRNLSLPDLQALTPHLQPVWANRQGICLSQPEAESGAWKDLLAAPLIVRDQVHGILGVLTATARSFTPQEQDRLLSVANLGILALENARMHDQIQREVKVLRRLIQAAKQMGEGQLSDEQIVELEGSAGWEEISLLSQAFAQMARQVIEREQNLHQRVRELEIFIDEARRDRQIAEITDSDYFQHIQKKAREFRKKKERR